MPYIRFLLSDIYLNNQNSGTISIINTTNNSIIKDIKLPFDACNSPTAIIYDQESNSLYVLGSPHHNYDNVSIISTISQSILTTIKLNGQNLIRLLQLSMGLDFSNNSIIINNPSASFIAINLSSNSVSYYYRSEGELGQCYVQLYNPYSQKEFAFEGYGVSPSSVGDIYIFSISIKNTIIPYHVSKIFLIIIAVIFIAVVIIIWRRHENKKYKDYTV